LHFDDQKIYFKKINIAEILLIIYELLHGYNLFYPMNSGRGRLYTTVALTMRKRVKYTLVTVVC